MARRFMCFFVTIILILAACPALGEEGGVVLNCWVYYSGVQEQTFSALVREFNDTLGMEQGIYVDYVSKSSISELDAQVRAAALREPGAEAMPELFEAYADTTFALEELGAVADLSPYLTSEEWGEYIDAYLDEGRMGPEDRLSIFPVAKSTELLLLNQTAWEAFESAVGADKGKLSTWEGITELAGAYYDWTDGLTPEIPGDGKAFFGRDAMANYLIIGAKQLGAEIFTVKDGKVSLNMDKAAMRKLWDNFCVPFAKGWFTAEGRYRSDDIKTGRLIALVGSTSGAMYFPREVTFDDGTTQEIECQVLPLPNFAGTEPWAVQQGAGFAVAKTTPEKEKAALTFLRWFTQPERNIRFSIDSGYLPVTKAANQRERIVQAMDGLGAKPMIRAIVETGAAITTGYHMYANKPFPYAYEARQVLDRTLLDAARAAACDSASMEGDAAFEAWYGETESALKQLVAD